MTTQLAQPYLEKHPGDLITAEDWNELQNLVRQDIEAKAAAAAAAVTEVGKAGDAAKLGGKTPEGFFEELLERALAKLHTERGYRMEFKCLKKGDPVEIKHDLGVMPLVDIYTLESFNTPKADMDATYFYIYKHPSQKPETPGFSIAFTELVELCRPGLESIHGKDWSQTIFDDMVDGLWETLLGDLYEIPACYCTSNWFAEFCFRKQMLVPEAMQFWDNFRFQMKPVKKTMNSPKITVMHQSFGKVGLTLNEDEPRELYVMVLLKA